MKINEAFEVHETLNPKLWDTATNKLLPEVREKIIEICTSFEDYIEAPIDIVDIQLVGSNASYNYTEHSDLDVHIIADFELVTENTEILKSLYDTKKSNFNKTMDITIHGVNVEMYIQDVNSAIISNGIYSVCDDEWIKEPKPIKSITKHNTEKELEKWGNRIKKVLESKDVDELRDAINMLYLMRRNSLSVDGEYGKGNQLFKEIRNKGWLQQLKDAHGEALSKKLSLESLDMSRGQIVNRME